MRRCVAIFVLSVSLAAATATRSSSQPDCPANTLVCVESTTTSTLPQGSCNAGWNYGGANCSYDAALGFVAAGFCCYFGWGSAEVADDFVVSNLPPGTPLSFRATLQLSLYGSGRSPSGEGAASGEIVGPDGTSVSYRIAPCCGHGASENRSIDVAVQALAGVPFRISYQAAAEADEGGQGIASGQLIFQDLPPAASVQSCHGYRQAIAVPAKAMTWGRVKLLYR